MCIRDRFFVAQVTAALGACGCARARAARKPEGRQRAEVARRVPQDVRRDGRVAPVGAAGGRIRA
eukprot:3088151-Alexandrium_andersonii.AAC.1